MKLVYKLWLNFGGKLPLNSDGKLIFEPYKGFMYDIAELQFIETKIRCYCLNIDELSLNKQFIENKIAHNTAIWKNGVRW